MVDAVQIWPPGTRFVDASGSILAGGSVEFYDAGTTDAKTVHSDSGLTTALGTVVYLDAGGAPVSEQGGSTKVQVYVGTDPYKVIVKDSAGVVQETKDQILGAFDSASILESLSIIAETEVETLTGDTTLDADDIGQLKNCNSTGGAFSITLPDATALSNGARFGVRMAGTANSVKIKTTGSQTIARGGVSSTAVALTKLGEAVWLVNDGGNWLEDTYVPPLHNTVGVIVIADRTATPPAASPGTRYIVTSGPTGAWSSYSENDIVEDDGQGGFYRITPAADCGWIAYVQDEDTYYFFIGSAWSLMGASDSAPGLIEIAVQSEMETGTDTARAVTPGRQHFHPLHPKAWGKAGSGGNLVAGAGISSVTDVGVGRITWNWSTAFSSSDYAVVAQVSDPGDDIRAPHVTAQSTTSITVRVTNENGSNADPDFHHVVAFGDQ